MLSNIYGEEVVFSMSNPNRAGIITPAEQPNEQDVLMLIMPMMIEN